MNSISALNNLWEVDILLNKPKQTWLCCVRGQNFNQIWLFYNFWYHLKICTEWSQMEIIIKCKSM